ncbi:hypothetical protein B0T14DRAFT_497212 [Immersiella caudata]|uniref:Uncharacterized protein n=1 Tax=Immersiella caudata TaxID=314043 RepID=A0AA39WSF6_9PEZI|nr:hypothetical protein B0T14DRAFT_497212 [Immersiella caudata]
MKLPITVAAQAFVASAAAAALPGVHDEAITSPMPVELDARATCAIHTRFVSTWKVAGYTRYRVEAWAEGYNSAINWHPHKMLEEWCRAFWDRAYDIGGIEINPQCWQEDRNGQPFAVADATFFTTSHGHGMYNSVHQETVNLWRDWSQKTCDVDSRH